LKQVLPSVSQLTPNDGEAGSVVKARLLPPPPWKAKLEQWLEKLPRRVHVPRLRPLSQVSPVGSGLHQWLSSGNDPAFLLEFEGGDVPHGWVYLEAALQRSMGNRVAKLRFDRGRGFDEHDGEFVPSNLRGSIRELIYIPADVVALRWDPCEARGYFSQTPLIFNEVGALERTLRMGDRVFTQRERFGGNDGGKLGLPWRGLVHAYLEVRRRRQEHATVDYDTFIRARERLAHKQPQALVKEPDKLRSRPHFIVHAGLAGEPDHELSGSLASVHAQSDVNWWLIDWRLPVARHQAAHMASAQSNAWHVMLRAGDILNRDALRRLGNHLLDRPAALVGYSDHDFMGDDGRRCSPSFKPDWDADLYYTHNYLANLCAVSARVSGANEVFSARPSAAAFAALVLAASRIDAREAITHVPEVLCHRRRDQLHGDPHGGEPSQPDALAAHPPLAAARIDAGLLRGTSRIVWPLPMTPPRVSVIIPTRDRIDLLRACVQSLLDRTTYPDYEMLIVDNDSETPEAAAYFRSLAGRDRIRVVPFAGAFNYSAINNAAAREAQGSLLLFLNNDTEVIAPGWMTDMVRHAVRPEVGAVGAKLLYSDGTVQHAGVVMGIGGVAGHIHRFLPGDEPGYGGRAVLAHAFTALTAACLMVRKDMFEAVGGFNAQDLVVACNDVDLCLKLHRRGLRNIFEPTVLLHHHESMTRGLDDTPEKRRVYECERDYMLAHWGREIDGDPAYNPNLSREHEDFSVRTDVPQPAPMRRDERA
jgi:O-antigen biosynthesis protein